MNTITQIPITGTIARPTDKEKLEALLTEFGVNFTEGTRRLTGSPNSEIICQQGTTKVAGYTWFYTTFEFDQDGKFIEMGAWE